MLEGESRSRFRGYVSDITSVRYGFASSGGLFGLAEREWLGLEGIELPCFWAVKCYVPLPRAIGYVWPVP